MEENFEQDLISQFLDEVYSSPCDDCSYRAECSLHNKTECCEKQFTTRLKAERVA